MPFISPLHPGLHPMLPNLRCPLDTAKGTVRVDHDRPRLPAPAEVPSVDQAEAHIERLLARLGGRADDVAESLQRAGVTGIRGNAAMDPVCVYLRQHLDPIGIRVDECQVDHLTFSVLNPDGETLRSSATTLPWPVVWYCCRADAGEFGYLFEQVGP